MTDTQDALLYEKMRGLITLIDRLRDFNLQDYISLPRVAVLGEQSAGKSSLLESIAGLNFLPRGSGIVTRRPLELRMICASVQEPYFVFPKDYPNDKLTNPDQVRSIIEQLTDQGAGSSKNISDNPIVCVVYSPQVPDLTLIDLPGITRNPTADQPDNIEEITKGLVRKYCEDPNTLILCVVPANIDLSTSDALSFARKLDPKGQRTLGVITKIDLMDEGTHCKNLLMNKEIILAHGYVGVKGRSQAEINRKTSVTEAMQNELNYFSKHPIYSSLPTELLGTRSLVERASLILFGMIEKCLPTIKKEIEIKKRKVMAKIEDLGEGVPEKSENRVELVFKLVRKFKHLYDQEVNGKYFDNKQTEQGKPVSNLNPRYETLSFTLTQNFNGLYDEYASKKYKASCNYDNDKISRALETYQGEAMPGFQSFDAFLYLIMPKIDLLKEPAYFLLNDSKAALETKGIEISDKVFKKYNTLNVEVKEAFLHHLNECKKKTSKLVENVIKNEETYVFTNDESILTGQLMDNKLRAKFDAQFLLVEEMRARVDRYFRIIIRNLKDAVPKLIGYFMVKQFNDSLEVKILNSLNKKDYCVDSLAENKTNMQVRRKMQAELNALTNAENLLVNEFDMKFDLTTELGVDEPVHQNTDNDNELPNEDEEEETEWLMNIEQINDDFLDFNQQLLANDINNIKQKHRELLPELNGDKTTVKGPGIGITAQVNSHQAPVKFPAPGSRNMDNKHSQRVIDPKEDNDGQRSNPEPIKFKIPSYNDVHNIHNDHTSNNRSALNNNKDISSINGHNNQVQNQSSKSILSKQGSNSRIEAKNQKHNLFDEGNTRSNLFHKKKDASSITSSKLNERDQPLYPNNMIDPNTNTQRTNQLAPNHTPQSNNKQPPLIQPKPKKIKKHNLFGD